MNSIELNHIDLNSIGLNSKVINGVGKSHGGKVKPYIAGHVTDGSSTFTFTVNTNESITVDVRADGWWKWYASSQSLILNDAFKNITNIDNVIFYKIKPTHLSSLFFCTTSLTSALKKVNFIDCDFTNCAGAYGSFSGCRVLEEIKGLDSTKNSFNSLNCTFQYCSKLEFPDNFKWENLMSSNITNLTGSFMQCSKIKKVSLKEAIPTTIYYVVIFCDALKEIYLPRINSTISNVNGWANDCSNVETINADYIAYDMTFSPMSKLKLQSVLNIINAAAANVTYTLHSTVYSKCASGGEWNTDVQAAIDAKALEGYTVTLISA